MEGKLEVNRDIIAEKLDEMADIAEIWKKTRKQGKHPNGARIEMLSLVEEIIMIVNLFPK